MTGKNPIDEALAQLPQELREKVRGQLEQSFARPSEETADTVYDTVRRRAALSGAFDPAQLVPEGVSEEYRRVLLGRLLSESTVVMRQGRRLWMLREAPRKEVLRTLSVEEASSELSRGYPASGDELSQTLAQYVTGTARPLEEQSVQELAKAAVVSQWLEGTPLGALAPEHVRQQLGFAQLLKPFEELLREGFAGRIRELTKLHDYVGVRPPESWTGWGLRELRALSRLMKGRSSYDPFVVHGAGGIGKSTLMAKFLIEHARQSQERRFPFVYLDFDRATLLPRQPLSLLQEMARQLAFQFPRLRDTLTSFAERQRGRFERQLLERRKSFESLEAVNMTLEEVGRDPRLVGTAARELREAVFTLSNEGRPFLLVLDTFEEVQRSGDDDVAEVLSLVRVLSDDGEWESFRVVISGRAPLKKYDIVDEIALKELDKDSALEFLRKRLPVHPRMLAEIVSHVGGSPLALKLAAGIVRRHLESAPQEQKTAKELVGVKRGLLDRALGEYDSESIAVQLYKRILDHIRDDEVEQLANPGLVLRRLTPELILEVLAEPCNLKNVDEAKARTLFEKMAKEVALVTRTGDVLVHRRDIRASMLELIHADLERAAPGKFDQINERAAAYYAGRRGSENRAEELYHYLLRDDVDRAEERWSEEAEPYLSKSAAELPASARAFLKARLNQALAPAERQLLRPAVWTRYAQQQAEQLLRTGKPDKAGELLSSRDPLSPSFAWCRLLGTALAETAEFGLALEEYRRGERLSEGDPMERFLLYRAHAELLFKKGDPGAWERFDQAAGMARLLEQRSLELECRIGQLGVERLTGNHDVALTREVRHLANEVSRSTSSQMPGVLRRLILFGGAEVAARDFLVEYFRVAPLTSLNEKELDRLELLVTWEPSNEVRDLLELARQQIEESRGLDVFAFENAPPHLVRELNDWLRTIPEVAVPGAKLLLVTRHTEWRLPARFLLMKIHHGWDPGIAQRFLPEHRWTAFSRMGKKKQAHELVEHADECGRLTELLLATTQPRMGSAIMGVTDALVLWERFLHLLVEEAVQAAS